MDTLARKIATTRIRDTQDLASAEARAAKALEHQRREKRRERNRALWAEHFRTLASSLRTSADEYDRKAQALCEEKLERGAM